jgi:HEAT repeat protein
VRFSVANALGHLGGAQALEALETMQSDTDSRVRELAAKMIKRLNTRRPVPRR